MQDAMLAHQCEFARFRNYHDAKNQVGEVPFWRLDASRIESRKSMPASHLWCSLDFVFAVALVWESRLCQAALRGMSGAVGGGESTPNLDRQPNRACHPRNGSQGVGKPERAVS
jgi:hypothetical protein